ncbi:branched-chain amino acid ABC transporter permease [Roseomonas xinghualingensis]|uniref:branched-chain amino acid ABC transporter permease n=1 Tax=Roseomonas xinghualingensis TaxID=2986475 RepID=UPI0021F1790B|nr:branched-chain amino acid ABC transporter permease [Roseomonas sp. SXEYE001]MCV4209200.1 branched-chain amino acid ABC transporter permease [Roseomonas sp. SXEYE001]
MSISRHPSSPQPMLLAHRPAAAGLVAVAIALPALWAGEFHLRFLAEILIIGTAVMSLDLLVGFGGLVSLGHAAPFGLAAYAAAIASQSLGGNLLLVLPLGAATGMAVAAVMGAVILRTSHLFLLILTLLLGKIAWEIVFHWREVTGGADGLRGLPPLSLGPWELSDARSLYLLAAGLALAATTAARSFAAAPLGRALIGIREQPLRMTALGYSIPRIRFSAMLAAGAIAGAAGALYPFVNLYVGPQSVHWTLSATMIVMLVIGGVGSLWGAFLGSAAYLTVQTYVSSYTDRWQLFVGLVFVLTVLLLPAGIAGGLRSLVGGWAHGRNGNDRGA